jgi:alkylated DNA repair protein (DNA oxidative demethylase)
MAEEPAQQLGLDLPLDPPAQRRYDRAEIAPGAVHVPGWLDRERQRALVTACRGWAAGPVPMARTTLPAGGVMSVRTVCLGWHWQPYRYTRTANGTPMAQFPAWLGDLGRAAVAAAYGDPVAAAAYAPDTALVNYYADGARLGLHRDQDERAGDPVVSLSIGDTCVFRFGNPEIRGRPYTDVQLRSGDLFVFGGPSRFAYHGVPGVLAGSGDRETGLRSGRLNLTLRVTGL